MDLANPALAIWFNGGPGSSSMFGNFLETGPIRVTKEGATNSDFSLGLNDEGSWVEIANVVFVDQPVGTGFSYGSPPVTDMQDGADEIRNFILGFYEIHPEFASMPLYITGESYSGKYIPMFAQTILNYNDNKASTDPEIPLQAVMICDPFAAPVIQRVNMPAVPRGLNFLDDRQMF
eukprot:CAMPEP_0170541832 /NCGR_PEP_ID=MMETSP0211-20121228/1451_1 /TAXON_ID=311385 /ORGANISM="Pseudokeronopsis sp., Strain OXSARD2" /LENGTH=176 /DNA_ID=CAMNT_0010844701 /DNA_START=318 /DNA_END=848 /DNA_ORIENTATION=-